MLASDRRRLELAYSLMLTLPGTPVLRYGDEIGMGDDLTLPERTCARTPMQWSDEPHGGFTVASKPVLPVISGGAYGFEHLNVAAQRRDPNSMLNWLERVVAIYDGCKGALDEPISASKTRNYRLLGHGGLLEVLGLQQTTILMSGQSPGLASPSLGNCA